MPRSTLSVCWRQILSTFSSWTCAALGATQSLGTKSHYRRALSRTQSQPTSHSVFIPSLPTPGIQGCGASVIGRIQAPWRDFPNTWCENRGVLILYRIVWWCQPAATCQRESNRITCPRRNGVYALLDMKMNLRSIILLVDWCNNNFGNKVILE